MSYTPKLYSVPARAISVLDERGALSTVDLSEALDIVPSLVRPSLQVAVKHGLMHFQRAGKGGLWHLGSADDADGYKYISHAEEFGGEAGEDEFLVSLFSDGEVAISGAQMTETGIVLSIEQVARLFKFFDHTAGYIKALGQERLAELGEQPI